MRENLQRGDKGVERSRLKVLDDHKANSRKQKMMDMLAFRVTCQMKLKR